MYQGPLVLGCARFRVGQARRLSPGLEARVRARVGTKAGRRGATRFRGGLTAAVACFALVGCGPILSTQSISDARDAVEQATSAEAETYATYEYISAIEYLSKAEEEWGYSDFQQAVDYARRAEMFAEQALERALRSPMRGAPVIEDPLDDL